MSLGRHLQSHSWRNSYQFWDSFVGCITIHQQQVFRHDVDKAHKYYITNTLRKPNQIPIHQFLVRVDDIGKYWLHSVSKCVLMDCGKEGKAACWSTQLFGSRPQEIGPRNMKSGTTSISQWLSWMRAIHHLRRHCQMRWLSGWCWGPGGSGRPVCSSSYQCKQWVLQSEST